MSASASAAAAPTGVAYGKSGAELEFGRIWSSIMAIMADNQPKLILFASPGRGQGTSTMASAIALTAAQANAHLRLGLLDANFRTPAGQKNAGPQSLGDRLREGQTAGHSMKPS